MRRVRLLALAALIQGGAWPQAPATHSGWKWERVITVPAAAPAAEQCVVLDAEVFADAAPGLRDVRLVQDGRELAFAVDVSEGDEGTGGLVGAADDRTRYEVSLLTPALPSEWPGAASGGASARPEHPPGYFYGYGILPKHVPVERIRLDPPPPADETVTLRAAEQTDLRQGEEMRATMTPEHPYALFTIGANLQQAADIRTGVEGGQQALRSFVLEMRQRELCYQPLSSSPLLLLFGNPRALPVHYDYALHYRPKASPLLASLGTMHVNPAYRPSEARRQVPGLRTTLLAAAAGCVLALGLTLRLLRRVRR